MSSQEEADHGNSTIGSKDRRVSRACKACRSRKSRCDLGVSGRPPCQRCVERGQECILATSRRGGRRIKGLKGSEHAAATAEESRRSTVPPSTIDKSPLKSAGIDTDTSLSQQQQEQQQHHQQQQQLPLDPDHEFERATGDRSRSDANDISDTRARGDWSAGARPSQSEQWQIPATAEQENDDLLSDARDGILEGRIASSDLLNPSDALHLLAQVADLESDEQPRSPGSGNAVATVGTTSAASKAVSYSHASRRMEATYPPISNGKLTVADAAFLLKHYQENLHPFFPIAYGEIFKSDKEFDIKLIRQEEYLLTAILTVASKDEPRWALAHDACSRHMETLISRLIYSGSSSVGSVEALLILAEWAPKPPQEDDFAIGCGKEDPGSWMLVGLAIRLGYLQGLEQTGLSQKQELCPEELSRQRIAWAACYMSDRQVSIRLGKGFWSRGPGPSTHLCAADFPSLQAQKLGTDNLALLFQANLELTQLFSNAHDILYSSTNHREQLYVGGEYVRYIDDFAAVLRRWKLSWGSLSLTPHVKSSLMLSYDFLRLYINAFAFQANLNRAIFQHRQRFQNNLGSLRSTPLFSDIAGAPDARFIYESIDAANSLLGTLNGFIDPEAGLRYMPLRVYLYIIYAAVFLYKAILAGPINATDASGIRRAVRESIIRLQKSSTNRHSIGQRYARSLRLLWRRSGKEGGRNGLGDANNDASAAVFGHGPPSSSVTQDSPSETYLLAQRYGVESEGGDVQPIDQLDHLNGFSWWDLDSLGQFITNNQQSQGVTDWYFGN
ncbi:hypothetical protein BX600DRAFT_468025 [Xylariales sp. PMI_506]|nr:hypothetical protein BX600DRAFT_468025 [Xylariales sp. PMI_506]